MSPAGCSQVSLYLYSITQQRILSRYLERQCLNSSISMQPRWRPTPQKTRALFIHQNTLFFIGYFFLTKHIIISLYATDLPVVGLQLTTGITTPTHYMLNFNQPYILTMTFIFIRWQEMYKISSTNNESQLKSYCVTTLPPLGCPRRGTFPR